MPCNYYHNKDMTISISPKVSFIPVPITLFLKLLYLQSQQPMICFLAAQFRFMFSRVLQKMNNSVCNYLCLYSFKAQYNEFEIIHVFVYQQHNHFYCGIVVSYKLNTQCRVVAPYGKIIFNLKKYWQIVFQSYAPLYFHT